MDMRKFCRTCESQTYLLLVDSVPNLQELMKTLLDIKPLSDQEAICMSCIKVIEDFRDFRAKSKAIDGRIRNRAGVKDETASPHTESGEENHRESMDYDESVTNDSENSTLADPAALGHLEMTLEEGEIGTVHQKPIKNSNMKVNFSIGSKLGPKQCTVCGKLYSNPSNLNRHVNKAHGGVQPKRNAPEEASQSPKTPTTTNAFKTCYVCYAKLPSLVMLKQHMLSHNSKKAFKCDECGQSYSLNQNLRRHQRQFCKGKIPKEEPSEDNEPNSTMPNAMEENTP